jgi:hypothetical protein
MDRRESGSDHTICVPCGRAAATALSWLSTALPELWLLANSVLGQPRTIHRDWNLVQPSYRRTSVRTPVNPMRRGPDPNCRPNHLILPLYAYPKNVAWFLSTRMRNYGNLSKQRSLRTREIMRLAGESACPTTGKLFACIGGTGFSLSTPACGRIFSHLLTVAASDRSPDREGGVAPKYEIVLAKRRTKAPCKGSFAVAGRGG